MQLNTTSKAYIPPTHKHQNLFERSHMNPADDDASSSFQPVSTQFIIHSLVISWKQKQQIKDLLTMFLSSKWNLS